MYLASGVAAVAQHVTHSTSGAPTLEPWQVINLIGAPVLALVFARPVIDDLKCWWAARRATHPESPD